MTPPFRWLSQRINFSATLLALLVIRYTDSNQELTEKMGETPEAVLKTWRVLMSPETVAHALAEDRIQGNFLESELKTDKKVSVEQYLRQS